MTLKPFIVLGLLALLITVSSACGGSGEAPISNEATIEVPISPTEVPSSNEVSIETPIANEVSIYEELLGLIPDTEQTRSELFINDYELAREVLDIPLPEPEADEEAVLEYSLALYSPDEGNVATSVVLGPFISGYSKYGTYSLGMRTYLGFDFRNVDQSIWAAQPPGQLEVVRGRFDPQATADALEACTECPPPLRAEHRGIPYYSWGEDSELDLTRRFEPPAFDHLGRVGRIAVQDNYVFRTVETSGMEAIIDASYVEIPSLADVEEYALLAEGAAEIHLYSLFLSDQTQSGVRGFVPAEAPDQLPALTEYLKNSPSMALLLRPYTALALGDGKDDNGVFVAIILVHADKEAARENVVLLGRRVKEVESIQAKVLWEELIGSVEVRADRRLLLAKLYTDSPLFSMNVYETRDNLFVHE